MAVVAALLLPGVLAAPLAARAVTGDVRQFTVASSGCYSCASSIVRGPDGALWLGEPLVNRIARITAPSVAPRQFPMSSGWRSVGHLVVGSDAAFWTLAVATTTQRQGLERVSTTGVVHVFPLSRPTESLGGLEALTAGPDGALWFTYAGSGGWIGRMTTNGVARWWHLGDEQQHLRAIVAGSDGALWFTSSDGSDVNRIGRFTTSGALTWHDLTFVPGDAVRGTDGAVWVVGAAGHVARVPVSGALTTYGLRPTPAGASPDVRRVVRGPRDEIWYAGEAHGGHSVFGRLDVRTGAQGSYEMPPDGNFSTAPTDMALASDGQMWAVGGGGLVSRLSVGGDSSYTVAVRGTDGHLHAWRAGDSSWSDLGGSLAHGPAVARFAGQNYYVIEGTDHEIYVRTDLLGWVRQPIGARRCPVPGATVLGTQLFLVCADGTSYNAQLRTGRLPFSWAASAGEAPGDGVELTTPAAVGFITPFGSWSFYAARRNGAPLLATWGHNAGWVFSRDVECTGRPAVARAGGIGYVACVNADRRLLWSTSLDGLTWRPAQFTAAGVLGGPGLAAQPDGTVLAFFERIDHTIAWTGLSRNGAGALHSFVGRTTNGVAAVGSG